MSILLERNTRHYYIFLFGLMGAFVLWTCFLSWFHGKETQDILFAREQTMVSSLMEQGVSPAALANAIKNSQSTGEGMALMQKIGHTDAAPVRFFPAIDQSVHLFARIAVGMVMILMVFLAGVTMRFLWKREKLYCEAEDIIARFSEGDFKKHLPQNENGSIYQLFAAVEELAVALRAQNEKEQQMKTFLKDTISDISHQLKTPLAALHMYTEIIAEEPDHRETVERFSGKTMQSLERMEQLVQTLLKVSRIDAGSIVFRKEKQSVSGLVADAIEDLSVRARMEGKQLLLKGDLQEEVVCDREWTREAIANLVKNALDHTDAGGVITVFWERSPAMFRLSVTDDGCGIDEEDMHHIFKRFYRSKRDSDRQGIGLGLSLAKSIVEGQGGILSVNSTPGEGAAFTIIFLTDM
ncbi:sensor histidine kinase [bacterium 0.1xD8-71]|nr:sensor histidine kinase [bacterium 0.1xD8-71]